MHRFSAYGLLLLIPLLFAMSPTKEMKYLALGDSYTIGESVAVPQTFPFLLTQGLKDHGHVLTGTKVIARTGWTTHELAEAMDKADLKAEYELVSLLIGVNNQYRGYPIKVYTKEFSDLLDRAIVLAKSKKEHVVVVSIPDYGCTPYGRESKEKIAREIDQYNKINKQIAGVKGVHYVDITPISRRAEKEPDLIAGDGLHPSAEMYTLWVEQLLPVAEAILTSNK